MNNEPVRKRDTGTAVEYLRRISGELDCAPQARGRSPGGRLLKGPTLQVSRWLTVSLFKGREAGADRNQTTILKEQGAAG